MIRTLLNRMIDAQEERLGAPLEYLREIADASLSAFFKFGLLQPLAAHRNATAADVLAVARLAATRVEDCGTCLQIAANVAGDEGVAPEIVRAASEPDGGDLPDDLARVHAFARAVARAEEPDPGLREELRSRYGDEGLVELALAVATARVYPTTKRALGHAVACRTVSLDVA